MDHDNMSNLTSAISNEASLSSSNNNNNHHLTIDPAHQPASKKRRNLPGNPDPEAEVLALSPRSLMATNRFVCEICNKGFQRDQNLQLHRRGHNLPWKLKQRNKMEVVKKKVYVCPEPSCVHHEPARALGDLTGIKKHFFRKHGEKKWKCDKCAKKYAVQSDWKAHSKICGTREYRCDCGTIFSRRDSFITHRAFCDALAQESSRISVTQQTPIFNMSSSQTAPNQLSSHHHNGGLNGNFHLPSLKQENVHSLINLPPWLSSDPGGGGGLFAGPGRAEQSIHLSSVLSSPPPLMSATALLQKAAQMGVTMGTSPTRLVPYNQSPPSDQNHHHHQGFNATSATNNNNNNNNNNNMNNFVHGLSSFVSRGNNGNNMVSSSLPSTSGGDYGGPSPSMGFEDSFNEMMNASKRDYSSAQMMRGDEGGMTRDFLGLRAFPDHRDFLNMAAAAAGGFDQMGSAGNNYNEHIQQSQNQGPWQS